ncbi:MAG: hypothetical protein AB7S26_38515 [Sandaracinaceae bacterium]
MTMRKQATLFVLAILSAAGCVTREGTCADEPDNRFCHMDGGGADAGSGDAAVDAARDASDTDAGPCGVCAAPTPVCDESTGDCVGCLVMNDCGGTTPQCDPVMHECVACLSSADCADPDNARCAADHTCQPCTDSMQCMGITGTEVCNSGTCVECTDADATACGTRACTSMNVCSAYDSDTQELCEPCDADANCLTSDNAYCVPMSYMGTDRGGYCLADDTPGCNQPYSITLMGRTTLSGRTGARYCGLNEALTTCEAVRALLDNTACPGGLDSECPQPGGLCRRVGSLNNRCTYPCGGDPAVCKEPPGAGSTCGVGTTSGPDYCGG